MPINIRSLSYHYDRKMPRKLRARGLDLPEGIVTIDALAEAICR